MVQVKVGPSKTIFRLHRKILYNVTPYFEAAFEAGFVEAAEQVLELPEENPVMFKHFQLYVYTGHFLAKEESEADISRASLLGLYIFGEMCGIPDLQNAAIDVLIDKQSSQNIIPTDSLLRVYNNTPEDSSLRRLFVDWIAYLATIIPNDRYTPMPPWGTLPVVQGGYERVVPQGFSLRLSVCAEPVEIRPENRHLRLQT